MLFFRVTSDIFIAGIRDLTLKHRLAIENCIAVSFMLHLRNVNIDYCIEEELELNVSFSLNYVKRMTGFSKVASEVTLGLSAERPMFMIYDLGNSSSLRLVLAPKIGEDD